MLNLDYGIRVWDLTDWYSTLYSGCRQIFVETPFGSYPSPAASFENCCEEAFLEDDNCARFASNMSDACWDMVYIIDGGDFKMANDKWIVCCRLAAALGPNSSNCELEVFQGESVLTKLSMLWAFCAACLAGLFQVLVQFFINRKVERKVEMKRSSISTPWAIRLERPSSCLDQSMAVFSDETESQTSQLELGGSLNLLEHFVEHSPYLTYGEHLRLERSLGIGPDGMFEREIAKAFTSIC